MIDVKSAVKIAVDYCSQLFGGAHGFRLEEVELSLDEQHWLITIGFDEEVTPPLNSMSELMKALNNTPTERKYKVVDVDANNGTIRAVKIRQPLERVS